MPSLSFHFPRPAGWLLAVLFGFVLLAVARAEGDPPFPVTVKGKNKGPVKNLELRLSPPTTPPSQPQLRVVPLLGAGQVLSPGGKLLVWVGLSDGTPIANATVKVSVSGDDNVLVENGTRALTVTLHTNANGIAEVIITAPNAPPGYDDDGDGGGPVA